MSVLGDRLAESRKSKGSTQKQMAELLSITPRAWQRYESGDREPNVEQLIKLADYFGVTLDYLVGRDA